MYTAPRAAFLFDLDGTLIDSVYQHVLAWREALEQGGIPLSVWRIHRRIGMSGGLFVNALLRETGRDIAATRRKACKNCMPWRMPAWRGKCARFPGRTGARALSRTQVPYAIATSGRPESAALALKALNVPPGVPVVTRDQVRHAKPDPDLFLAAAERLGVPIQDSIVVGDSIWDLLAARRARAIGVGLLSGGYGQEELERAGAFRVYQDPLDLLTHLDELGVRRAD